jgi:2-keto-3-deoxy-galactonokinase
MSAARTSTPSGASDSKSASVAAPPRFLQCFLRHTSTRSGAARVVVAAGRAGARGGWSAAPAETRTSSTNDLIGAGDRRSPMRW